MTSPSGAATADAYALYRVIVQVGDIEAAAAFYGTLFAAPGRRGSPGRHYFDCDQVVLACFDPRADGDGFDATANPDYVYFAVADLAEARERALAAGARNVGEIADMPWGERLFYLHDPFGNPLCMVDSRTVFRG